jgi:hypothetical protein
MVILKQLHIDNFINISTGIHFKYDSVWDTVSYSLVEVDQRFRGAYCHHHQGGDYHICAL